MQSMRVGKQVKKSTMDLMNDLVEYLFRRVADQARDVCEHSKNKVLRGAEIEAAVKMVFPKGLVEYCVEESQDRCRTYKEAVDKKVTDPA